MGNYLYKIQLKKFTYHNTKKFEFSNRQIHCKVIDVYDGDTITVAIKLEKNIYAHKVRMYGYDSPEIKPKLNVPNREAIIEAAKISKNVLVNKLLNKIVILETADKTWDKYGRLLGTIYVKSSNNFCNSQYVNVNEFMINNNFGYAYYGGKKRG